MAQLSFEEEERTLFIHLLREGRTVIGRSDQCDVALPSESISRVHCIVEGRGGAWRVVDRSRHGTVLNGERVEASPLRDGDRITIGTYGIRFREDSAPILASPTATAPMPAASFEELLEGDGTVVATRRAQVQVSAGPRQGERIELTQARTSFGGPGADLELDDQLPRHGGFLRVVRGRAMVEPGTAAVYLAGRRVRDITPMLPGEEIKVGQHAFVLEVQTREDRRERDAFGDMVGRASVMRRMFGALSRMAAHDSPVLLVGESGTGKELAARAIHTHGSTREGPFVAVNCAAIAPNLVESELFGHEKGAFTGATERRDGAFHHASGGTLFLDEIGEMPLELQAKLLRALESGEVRRVGGAQPTFPDVRVVAATNRNLAEMTQDGSFREDLYWRLAVLTVRLPALRERLEDVPLIARTLLARHHPDAQLTQDALDALLAYAWPGNVRELRNVLTRAYVLSGPLLGASDLSFNPWAFDDAPTVPAPMPTLEEQERARIRDALKLAEGNRTHAARLLGIPRSTLLYKVRRLGIDG